MVSKAQLMTEVLAETECWECLVTLCSPEAAEAGAP